MRILTNEERAKIEKLIEAGLKPSLIAEVTGRSRSVINKLANGTYDALKEKERLRQREKAKKQAQTDKPSEQMKHEAGKQVFSIESLDRAIPAMTLAEQILLAIDLKLKKILDALEVK